jgi:hypothetical protein
MAKTSFLASAAITQGQLLDVQADDTVRVYPANARTNPPAGIAYETVASGEYVTVWDGGSSQVYAIASGTIASGDPVWGPGIAPTTAGSVATAVITGNVSGSYLVGFAQSDATDGNPVRISVMPSIV